MEQETTRPDPSPEDRPIRVGIAGFGQLPRHYYVPALRTMPQRLEICVADPNEGARAAATDAFTGARTYADCRHMLESESLHAVLVCSPPSTHLELWRLFAAAGLPVFMEKPFLLPDELDLIDPTDIAWRKLMINFNRRFWPAYQNLCEQIANGSFGEIRRALFVLEVNAAQWSKVSDHRSSAGEGGVLLDLGSHVMDLVLTAFGERPAEISAYRSVSGRLQERIVLELRFSEGFVVECVLAYGTRNREQVWIKGDKAEFHLCDPNFLCWVVRQPSIPAQWARSLADLAAMGYRGCFRSRSMLRWTVRAALETFLDAVEHSQPFTPGFADALAVAECIRDAALAVRTDPVTGEH